MLNIKDAIELYLMLKDFIPDYEVGDDLLEFTGKIVSDIGKSDRPEAFGQSILLMYPKISVEKLSEMKSLDVVSIFVKGLSDNKVLSLMRFCEALGYG